MDNIFNQKKILFLVIGVFVAVFAVWYFQKKSLAITDAVICSDYDASNMICKRTGERFADRSLLVMTFRNFKCNDSTDILAQFTMLDEKSEKLTGWQVSLKESCDKQTLAAFYPLTLPIITKLGERENVVVEFRVKDNLSGKETTRKQTFRVR